MVDVYVDVVFPCANSDFPEFLLEVLALEQMLTERDFALSALDRADVDTDVEVTCQAGRAGEN